MFDELKFVGNRKQLFHVREVQLVEGKSNNVRVIEVNNNSGLYFEVNVDRGFDIPILRYNGVNIGYLAACDNSSPKYFDDNGLGFVKNFTVGFLTTCGLKSIGSPSTFNNKEYGLHGTYSNTPADHYYYNFQEDEKGSFVELNASVYDAALFEDKLKLERKIKCYYKSNRIIIDDTVTNESFNDAMHNILYHMNMGYPLLSPDSKMYLNSDKVTPRTKRAEDLIDVYNIIEEPQNVSEETCYYHQLHKTKNNKAVVGVFNPKLKMGVAIIIDCENLDNFVEWKSMQKRDYVLGLEPSNNLIDGLNDLKEKDLLKYLKPGEKVKYHLEVQIIEDYSEFETIFNQE